MRHAMDDRYSRMRSGRGTTRKLGARGAMAAGRSACCCTRRATARASCACCAWAGAAPRPSSRRALRCSTRHATKPSLGPSVSTRPAECSQGVGVTSSRRSAALPLLDTALPHHTEGQLLRAALLIDNPRCCCSACAQMKTYATDEAACRHATLLAYFGEHFAKGRCGDRCDVCLAARGVRSPDDWKVGAGFCSLLRMPSCGCVRVLPWRAHAKQRMPACMFRCHAAWW